jgi:hypothetical protein
MSELKDGEKEREREREKKEDEQGRRIKKLRKDIIVERERKKKTLFFFNSA